MSQNSRNAVRSKSIPQSSSVAAAQGTKEALPPSVGRGRPNVCELVIAVLLKICRAANGSVSRDYGALDGIMSMSVLEPRRRRERSGARCPFGEKKLHRQVVFLPTELQFVSRIPARRCNLGTEYTYRKSISDPFRNSYCRDTWSLTNPPTSRRKCTVNQPMNCYISVVSCCWVVVRFPV